MEITLAIIVWRSWVKGIDCMQPTPDERKYLPRKSQMRTARDWLNHLTSIPSVEKVRVCCEAWPYLTIPGWFMHAAGSAFQPFKYAYVTILLISFSTECQAEKRGNWYHNFRIQVTSTQISSQNVFYCSPVRSCDII